MRNPKAPSGPFRRLLDRWLRRKRGCTKDCARAALDVFPRNQIHEPYRLFAGLLSIVIAGGSVVRFAAGSHTKRAGATVFMPSTAVNENHGISENAEGASMARRPIFWRTSGPC